MYKDGFSPQLWSCWQGLYFTAEHFSATLLAGMFLATWDSVYWLARQHTALYYPAHSLMTILQCTILLYHKKQPVVTRSQEESFLRWHTFTLKFTYRVLDAGFLPGYSGVSLLLEPESPLTDYYTWQFRIFIITK